MNATHNTVIVWGEMATERSMKAQAAAKRAQALREPEEVERLRSRYSEVTALAARLIDECRRLRTDNEDLRRSAEIWIAMYEQQLERANGFEQQLLAGPRRD